jgi:UDP-glucose 4-epimerase
LSTGWGKVLVTGGAGYIGSHVVAQLRDQGCAVVVLDNLSTGNPWAVSDAELLVEDLADYKTVATILERGRFDCVLHFAASIVVEESVQNPLKYYLNNTRNTANLLEACDCAGVERLVFSSTAAVYGLPGKSPVDEETPLAPISPYGDSKRMSEQMLSELGRTSAMRYVIFRYFNVAGAHPTGELGETSKNPTHLIPAAYEAAMGKRPKMVIHGGDYPTRDGTGIRDFIHVDDLADAHVLALRYLMDGGASEILNCGYGNGNSVKEVIEVVKSVTGTDFSVDIGPRREGDPAELVASADRVREVLGWTPRHDDLEDIVRTGWNWHKKRAEFLAAKERGQPRLAVTDVAKQ